MCEEIINDIILQLAVPTKELQLKDIQVVLHRVKAVERKQNMLKPGWCEMVKLLWEHLQTGLKRQDDQLLCSVCFYTALASSTEKEIYLDKILTFIDNELDLKKKSKTDRLVLKDAKTLQVVSLMYGILQSKFVINVHHKKVVNVLDSSLDLLILMAYEYSRYTFIVFKTISCFYMVYGTELQNILFSEKTNYLLRLKLLANHNWENPITGVRDLNKTVFQIVMVMCGKTFRHAMMDDINNFYWNKAKYLMLAIRLEHSKTFKLKDDWIKGLFYSLNKPGLVSAGADMYYIVLNRLITEDDWCNIFLEKVTETLSGNNLKAIENFSNYWCMTTFKKFPHLPKILLKELNDADGSEGKLYSTLCITKQAVKLSLLNRSDINECDYIETALLVGIEFKSSYMRKEAFEIVVKLGKIMPNALEYKVILNYLCNNINSDCTVLRISMLGNMAYFLNTLCSSYMSHTKHNKSYDQDELLNFYKGLQEFIISSLNLDGNYQRKIATIKLCSILMSTFAGVRRKREQHPKACGSALMQFLNERDCLILFSDNFMWKLLSLLRDPADDVREHTMQLLLENYYKQITPDLINQLIEDAKSCVQSKFFFEISCGQSIFRLIVSLLSKENYIGTLFKDMEGVFTFAFEVLKSEYEIKRDIVKSIEDGKQLHAYLGVLLMILKVSKLFDFEFKYLRARIPEIIKILDHASTQFVMEEDPAVSSDFSKMSDMVQEMIEASGYSPVDEQDFTKISGLQQIVLNCMWLNVKASCDLASYLTTFLTSDEDEAVCRMCLAVITRVLETSRHKGAIEAAGAALGRTVQYLTALPAGAALAALPARAARAALAALAARRAASVTRRAAGRAVLLHRIVASDAQKDKPLFHSFMQRLLQTCNSCETGPELDEQKDEPKAVYIHLLTRAVTDSGLASDTMYYSADLAEIAFGNLTSPHWQIRNAALQLYGALIPKLIGQKKASGEDDESVSTVAIDEFVTHFPRLAQHMVTSITHFDCTNPVESHSNVIPIINVLANLAKRYHFEGESVLSTPEIFESLLLLLGSPIYAVRRLTGNCIYNIYDYHFLEFIMDKIKKDDFKGENLLHGTLKLAKLFKHRRKEDPRIKKFFTKFRKFVGKEIKNHSYICRKEYDMVYGAAEIDIKGVLLEVKLNKHSPGVFSWANTKIEKYITSCSWYMIPDVVKLILKETDHELYLDFILQKLKKGWVFNFSILIDISKELLAFDEIFCSSKIWEILFEIVVVIGCYKIDMCPIDRILEMEVPYRARFAIPILARICRKLSKEQLIHLSNIIFSLCDPHKSDIEMRCMSATANNELALIFKKLPDCVKITTVKCAVLLLQDEDEDVRIINIQFYARIVKKQTLLHPYMSLHNILNKDFLHSCLHDPLISIPALCEGLLEILESYAKSGNTDEFNPFTNDSKNIYFESEVVKKLIEKLK